MNALFALAVATAILVLIPGPNVALIVANALQYGFRAATKTVLGTTAGVGLQLILVVIGLASLVDAVADAMIWIRWAGVAYLLILAVQTWRSKPAIVDPMRATPPVFWRALMIAAINPKTLLFSAAFIPQFAGEGGADNLGPLAAVFLLVLFLGDMLWAAFATSARHWIARSAGWRNRLSGSFLALAALGLAAAHRNQS